ncbi:MAG: hypothetical protein ACJ79E_01715 [Anaeromyxobacteraceae bacterium]
MLLNHDFRDLFAELNAAGAEYLLVGGYALAYHHAPRSTGDLDVWIRSTPENAARVLRALASFGAPLSEVTAQDLSTPGLVFQMGVRPCRIDVLTAIDGVAFEDAWAERVESRYADQPLHVIGRRHLLVNKRASGRPQDLLDADALERDGP